MKLAMNISSATLEDRLASTQRKDLYSKYAMLAIDSRISKDSENRSNLRKDSRKDFQQQMNVDRIFKIKGPMKKR